MIYDDLEWADWTFMEQPTIRFLEDFRQMQVGVVKIWFVAGTSSFSSILVNIRY